MVKWVMRGSLKFKINLLFFCSIVFSFVFFFFNMFFLFFYLELVYNWFMIWFFFVIIWLLMLVFLYRYGYKNIVLLVKWNSNGNWVFIVF